MQFKDYYEILGVPATPPADEIKKAFRQLARKYHPDVSKAPDAEARMKEINEAYAVLSDPERRVAYDQLLGRGAVGARNSARRPAGMPASSSPDAASPTPRPPTSATSSRSCSVAWAVPRARAAPAPARGRAASGPAARITTPRSCSTSRTRSCGARRQVSLRAPELDAQGRVVAADPHARRADPEGRARGPADPPRRPGCAGRGRRTGRRPVARSALQAAPALSVHGRDLRMELPVAPWEAALGAIVPVRLPHGGTLKVRIPAGAQGGRSLRVRGRGHPRRSAGRPRARGAGRAAEGGYPACAGTLRDDGPRNAI